MKRFNLLAFLLGIVTVTAIAAKITTNELKIGQKVAEDITIEFDKGLGANNPFFKWNDASGALQFSNDGTNTFDIGSGAGGGGGVNFLVNGGFESGAVNWTNAGSGAFAETTAAAKVGRGGKAGNWDAAAASDTLTSDQQTVSNIDGGGKCVARWSYVGGDINITARVIDGALSVLASKQLSNQVSYVTDTFNFTCPASGTVAFELVSAGDAPEISLDEVFVGFIQVNDLTDLTDVSHAAPADKDVMAYDSATGAYYGRAPPATSLNYVLNDDLEISVTEDITNTAEISASSFVSTPLRGAQSVELITTASATTADYIGFDMRTFEAQDINKLQVLEFDFKDDSSYAAGDLEVIIYDLDNAAEILPTNTAIPAGGGRFQALWVATDADDYEIRFKVATASTVFDKVIDNIRVGPVADGQVGSIPYEGWKSLGSLDIGSSSNPQPAKGESGSPTIDNLWVMRVGDTAHFRGEYQQVNATGAAIGTNTYIVRLPVGYTPDASKIDGDGINAATTLGSFTVRNDASPITAVGTVGLFASGSRSVYFWMDDLTTGSTALKADAWGSTSTINLSSPTLRFSFSFSIPIAEWAGETVSMANSRVEYAYNNGGATAAGASDTTNFAYGPDGVAIGNIASTTANSHTLMRVRFQNAIQATDHIDIEVSTDNDTWVSANSHSDIQARIFQSTSRYGIGWDRTSGSNTDIDVVFGNKGRQSTNATYAGDGATWAGISSYKWRAVKSSNPLGIGAGLATATAPGAVDHYSEFADSSPGGEWISGTVKGVRIGNQVTITIIDANLPATGGDVKTSGAIVPGDFRPSNGSPNYVACYISGGHVHLVNVNTNGTVDFSKRDWAGVADAAASNFSAIDCSMSYVVN